MKFKDLLKNNTWPCVEIALLAHYPDEKKNSEAYMEVLNGLKLLTPKETAISICVSWEKDDFDQSDYVHVAGYYNNPAKHPGEYNGSLAIEFTPWSEWLGMDIDINTLETFNECEIIAHCLYEMTFCGFTEKDILAEWKKIEDACDEINNMTEEEKKVKLKSWEDLKKEWDLDEEKDKEED